MKKCGRKDCCVSTTIAETLSFGRGELDQWGFWEIPCRQCAEYREFVDSVERENHEYMPYWPMK